jgi:hypothetical protein
MVDAWLVRGYRLPWEHAPLWSAANQRVLGSRRLRPYLDIIMADGYGSEPDHLRWVIRGRVGEIEAWAKQVEEDSDARD